MAEVFVEYSEPVVSKEGRTFIARACGAEMDGSRWQGWLEFQATDGGSALRSGRETTQPNRTDTAYWATGLTPVYLEGALDRALNPLPRVVAAASPASVFEGPVGTDGETAPTRESVMNPFSVYRKGESMLRSQLHALSGWHLVNIIEAYGLSAQHTVDLQNTPAPVLVELIVSSVRERTLSESPR
jgi:hypothetical protein